MEHELTGRIGGRPVGVGFQGDVAPTPEAAVSAFLYPAMREGAPLEVDGPVSRLLLDALPTIQGIVTMWWPEHRHVEVRARPAEAPRPAAAGTAAFFSGGVDSFYTALRHRDRITGRRHQAGT